MVSMHPERAAVFDLPHPEIQTCQILAAFICHISDRNQPPSLRVGVCHAVRYIAQLCDQLHQLVITAVYVPNDIKFISTKFQYAESPFPAFLHLQLPFTGYIETLQRGSAARSGFSPQSYHKTLCFYREKCFFVKILFRAAYT